MAKKKGVMQKTSLILASVSIFLAIASGVMLYLNFNVVDRDNTMIASYTASTFFFLCVGFVLTVIGKTDIPSFKFDDTEDK